MGTRDPRIDAYIAKSEPFARPILRHLREVVHAACPEVEEAIKWSSPHFMYKGMFCGMASFKSHCAFGFWKGALLENAAGPLTKVGTTAMGQFGRITSLDDLPDARTLTRLVKLARRLNDEEVKPPAPTKSGKPKPPARTPADLAAALKRHKKAAATFKAFSPSHRREYIEWLEDAKTDATRARRLEAAVEWMDEGKPRNWKYMKTAR